MAVADLVGHPGERTAHLAFHGVGRQERLGIHRVHVVDAVQQRRRHAAVTQGPGDDVEDDRAPEAPDVDGPRGRLRVVDDLGPVNRGGQLVGPVHRVRPWPFDRRAGAAPAARPGVAGRVLS